MTKKIIIKIIVAVVVAVILSKLKLIGLMSVNASALSTTFTYNNAQITQNPVIMNFNDTNGFAYGYDYGEFKASIFLEHSELSFNGVDTRGASLKQAYLTLTNNFQAICDVGSPSSPVFYSSSSSGTFNYENYNSTLYTIKCNVNPTYSGIKTLTLVFNRTSSLTRLSVGPVVTFTEDESNLSIKKMQNEIKKQNETCAISKNLFGGFTYSQTASGITFTYNTNGSITASGTANGIDAYSMYSGNATRFSLSPGTYYVKGVSDNVRLEVLSSSNRYLLQTTSSGTFNLSQNDNVWVRIYVPNGTSIDKTFKIMISKENISYEPFGETVCKNKQDLALEESQKQTQAQNETNDLINNDNVDDSTSQGSSFFNDFSSNTPSGLSGIISSPLRLLSAISSSTCSSLTFPLPFVNNNVSIPCMSSIYRQYFSSFLTIYQIITTGLIGYWVCINLFRIVKGLQNPENDKIEVLDL